MPPRTVRTTVSLPTDLLDAADRAVQEGRARTRNELVVTALRREITAQERSAIDAAFADMAEDAQVQREAGAIVREFAMADWEALQLAELEG
jgi:metal-responsive CopG/Arc/MetJ family transcriptional regulator